MRTSSIKLNPIIKNQIGKTFTQLICDFKSPEEVDKFFKVFFNESEYETFIKRLAVSYWLKKNRSYSNIKTNLKVSSATIASIQNNLDSEGMKIAIKKLEADEWANVWAEKINKLVKGR